MPSVLPPHAQTTGFVYGVLDAGVKYAHVLVAGHERLETFDFALPVPGASFVGTGVRADSVYPSEDIKDLDLDMLRKTLASYACCTKDSTGTRDGDPLNLVVVQSQGDPLVLLRINMEAGHAGASGRFERLKEVALAYAFALTVAGTPAA